MNWNTKNPRWGQVWTEVRLDEFGQWQVSAALEGTMTGVQVADFARQDAARAFAEDFGQGKIFALKNGHRWVQMVESARAARPLALTNPGDREGFLLSYGRAQGTTLDGKTLGIKQLRELYEGGKRI